MNPTVIADAQAIISNSAKVMAQGCIDNAAEEALSLLMAGWPAASVQDWVGGVYVSLTAVKTCDDVAEAMYVWTIGVPEVGESMAQTVDRVEAVDLLRQAIKG